MDKPSIAIVGIEVTMSVENIGDRPLCFLAGMRGKALPT